MFDHYDASMHEDETPYERAYDDRDELNPGPEGTVDVEFSEMCADHL